MPCNLTPFLWSPPLSHSAIPCLAERDPLLAWQCVTCNSLKKSAEALRPAGRLVSLGWRGRLSAGRCFLPLGSQSLRAGFAPLGGSLERGLCDVGLPRMPLGHGNLCPTPSAHWRWVSASTVRGRRDGNVMGTALCTGGFCVLGDPRLHLLVIGIRHLLGLALLGVHHLLTCWSLRRFALSAEGQPAVSWCASLFTESTETQDVSLWLC